MTTVKILNECRPCLVKDLHSSENEKGIVRITIRPYMPCGALGYLSLLS